MKIQHSFSLLLFGGPPSLIRAQTSAQALHRHMAGSRGKTTLTLVRKFTNLHGAGNHI
jgi:hypothetical protein